MGYPKRWGADEIKAIRRLARAGCSSAQIAAEFGATRNAIIGICHRQGIPLGGSDPCPKRRAACSNAKNVLKAAQKRKEARQRLTAPLVVEMPEPAPARKPVPSEGILLEALTKSSCRWPFGDHAPFKFCGAHADCGPYCPEHTVRGRART
jgi:GcrA cell cycle regulator